MTLLPGLRHVNTARSCRHPVQTRYIHNWCKTSIWISRRQIVNPLSGPLATIRETNVSRNVRWTHMSYNSRANLSDSAAVSSDLGLINGEGVKHGPSREPIKSTSLVHFAIFPSNQQIPCHPSGHQQVDALPLNRTERERGSPQGREDSGVLRVWLSSTLPGSIHRPKLHFIRVSVLSLGSVPSLSL